VVDDNETNRMVLESQLAAWDMRAEVAADGSSALQRLRQANLEGAPYDVALLDLAMPGMDGLELARAITADPALASTPLLLLSSMPVEAEAATEAGFGACLTKPVRLSQLYDHMVRAVGRIAAPAVAPQPPRAHGERGHVLVVEDQSINQTVARGILDSLGYGCDVAANGIEALEALELRSYDAVLMDCHMPEMDGYEATTEIRRREEGQRRTPIIAMTAAALPEDHNKCLAAGMDDFVSKPVTAQAVQDALAPWVEERQPSLEPFEPPMEPQPEAPLKAPDDGLDLDRLDMLRTLGPADGWGLLPSLVRLFVKDGPDWVASVRDAVEAHDGPLFAQRAHRLKGAAANIGATGVGDLCEALELAGPSAAGESESALLLDRLDAELARTAEALAGIVATAP
jgi:CheY-like chemotaxis protein/HPt (histidine-containing phosphotransfer) domain-containing protein